jgi:adenine-specific DNA methylase
MAMTEKYRRKLIEVSIPLEAINKASATEKSIRHGHPSTLHLWWARRPLAACRATIFAQLVDDPSSWPERFPTEADQKRERDRLASAPTSGQGYWFGGRRFPKMPLATRRPKPAARTDQRNITTKSL